MNEQENQPVKERDFHQGEGHAIPTIIKIVWIVLLSWAVIYFFKYSIPDLKTWLK